LVKELLTGKRLAGILVMAVLAVLICRYGFRSLAAPAQQAVAVAAAPGTVTVTGLGEVRVPPDSARMNLGVVTEAKTAREAQTANNRSVNAVIAALRAQGIPKENIQTSEFRIWPQTDEKGRNIVSYHVTHTLAVKVDGVDKVGAVLDAAVSAGANHSYGISFERGDQAALEREALRKALAEARARAEALAAAAGKKIVRVVSVREADTQPDLPAYKKLAAEAGAGGVPVEPGELTVTAAVEVVFEIGN
jgi:uncharacterized protein YggE